MVITAATRVLFPKGDLSPSSPSTPTRASMPGSCLFHGYGDFLGKQRPFTSAELPPINSRRGLCVEYSEHSLQTAPVQQRTPLLLVRRPTFLGPLSKRSLPSPELDVSLGNPRAQAHPTAFHAFFPFCHLVIARLREVTRVLSSPQIFGGSFESPLI